MAFESHGFSSVPTKLSKHLHDLDNAWRQRQRAEDSGEGFPCSYCGATATSMDHVPPRSMREHLTAVGVPFDAVEVPACHECNCLLGNIPLLNLKERKAHIKRRLRQRYAALLRIPDWGDSELFQLAPPMRAYILNGILLRDFVLQRLRW